jgi:hypothetical protein
MKVLVATKKRQGARHSDFSDTNDGELIVMVPVTDCGDGSVDDDKCGCRRSFIGIDSHRRTTTVEVVEVMYGEKELTRRIRTFLKETGDVPVHDVTPLAMDLAEFNLETAWNLEVGDVVEKRETGIQQRLRLKALETARDLIDRASEEAAAQSISRFSEATPDKW